MEPKIHTLKNGLRVVLVPQKDSQTATVVVMAGTGSRYENKKENGMAHFLEHMFFKGTKKRPTAKAISEELDSIGGVSNAFTSKDRTAYYAKVSKEHLPVALDVVSDIFLNSTLPGKEINKERGAIIQEINMYEDMPMRNVDNVFEGLLFGIEHPLGRTILGPKENILSFSRDEFVAYLNRNYAAANTVIAVAGAFSEKKVLEKIKKDFSKLPQGKLPVHQPFMFGVHAPAVAIKHKKTDQTQLMLGVPAYPHNHKDEYALEILATILGAGMSSRLFSEIRERRGLAYYVRAWAEKFADTGYFVIQAGTEHEKLPKVVTTALAELRKLKTTPVSPAELRKAKAHTKGSLALSLDTSDAIAQYAASSMTLLNKIETTQETMKKLDEVTAKDVQRVAKDIFKTERLKLAVIGPHENTAKLKALLRV